VNVDLKKGRQGMKRTFWKLQELKNRERPPHANKPSQADWVLYEVRTSPRTMLAGTKGQVVAACRGKDRDIMGTSLGLDKISVFVVGSSKRLRRGQKCQGLRQPGKESLREGSDWRAVLLFDLISQGGAFDGSTGITRS